MIAFHYTAAANWDRIETEGLVPYRIDNHPELPGDLLAIWAWPERMTGGSLIGQLVHRCIDQQTWSAVCIGLEVDSQRVMTNHPDGEPLRHTGFFIGSKGRRWVYHEDLDCLLVTEPVPAERVWLDARFDIGEFVNAIDLRADARERQTA